MNSYINPENAVSRIFVGVNTNLPRPRGRPRLFDAEQAVETAQQLFHARGYDSVSVADLTQALGINPPSFYAAFGSKAALYARVLCRYAGSGAIPLDGILRSDCSVAEGLAMLLEAAAFTYAADPAATGCLVLESLRCNDLEARESARAANVAAEDVIRRYVADRHPKEAQQVGDFVAIAMTGLSAKSRDGYSLERLLASARLASSALPAMLGTRTA